MKTFLQIKRPKQNFKVKKEEWGNVYSSWTREFFLLRDVVCGEKIKI
jgi:hypothetical protein